MTAQDEGQLKGEGLAAGAHHYRAFVGPPDRYDLVAANQFSLLTLLGLRQHHYLLDIGCGSLRAGRLFIPYLLPGRYFGIEPEQWLIDEGIRHELGADLVRIKSPVFSNDAGFNLSAFDVTFDFIVAQSIFSHASEQQIRRCLAQVKQVMAPQGIFAASFRRGNDNYSGSEWAYPRTVAYTLPFMRELANAARLECTLAGWRHPGELSWVLFTHPGRAASIPAFDSFLIDALDDEPAPGHTPPARGAAAPTRLLRAARRLFQTRHR